MLLSFSVENWASFKNKVTISAIAGRQRTHRDRLKDIKSYNIRILPVLAIYGANASGKSKLCEALAFAKRVIVKGTEKDTDIDVEPFILCKERINQPSSFWFEFVVKDQVYEYMFSATKERIVEENLTLINRTSESLVFQRKNQSITGDVITKDPQLGFISKGTRENQLFITNCAEQNNTEFRDIYNWFKNSLRIIRPDSKFSGLRLYLDEKSPLFKPLNEKLLQMDTGLKALKEEPFTEDKEKPYKERKNWAKVIEKFSDERFVFHEEDGINEIGKVITMHESDDGTQIPFKLAQESDGTQRLLDLLPAFVGLPMTYIIDEIDRSIHHLLLRRLLEQFLTERTQKSLNQIIFTTHDLLLMDQDILRRDEMYVIEKDSSGISSIIPLNEYKGIRYDKDILKSYLQGRLGGVPRI